MEDRLQKNVRSSDDISSTVRGQALLKRCEGLDDFASEPQLSEVHAS